MNKESALSILVFFASGKIKITRRVVACSAQICLQHLVMSPSPSGYVLTLTCSVLSCLRGIVSSTVTVLSPMQRRNAAEQEEIVSEVEEELVMTLPENSIRDS